MIGPTNPARNPTVPTMMAPTAILRAMPDEFADATDAVFFHVNQPTTSAQTSDARVAANMPRPCTTASRNSNPAVVTEIKPANSYATSATSAVTNTRPDVFITASPSYERSVPEVSSTGKHHREASLIGRGDHFLIAHGTTGLHHGRCASVRHGIQSVAERKECVRRGN